MNEISALEKIQQESLKKHVSAIHCSNSLSLLQRKISNVLLYHAYPTLTTQDEHRISIRELCGYLEYKGFNYEKIKDALKKLISTVVEWNVFENDVNGEDWTASSILASVNIKNAVCSYAYSPRMKQLLYSPIMYGRVDLRIQSGFKSNYGLALYENCSRYRKLKKTKVFSLYQFRKIMGVDNGKYLSFRDFKKRVLDKAVREVNDQSDLNIICHLNRAGKDVVSVFFEVFEKKNSAKRIANHKNGCLTEKMTKEKEKGVILENMVTLGLVKKLRRSYLLNDKTIEDIIVEYGPERIEEKLIQLESAPAFIKGEVMNISGFLLDALKKDYVFKASSKLIYEEKRIFRENAADLDKKYSLKQEKEKKENEINADKQICRDIDKLGEKELAILIREFEVSLKKENNFFVLKELRKHGLKKRITRVFFRGFLKSRAPEMLS